jgi:hypothetical protein
MITAQTLIDILKQYPGETPVYTWVEDNAYSQLMATAYHAVAPCEKDEAWVTPSGRKENPQVILLV